MKWLSRPWVLVLWASALPALVQASDFTLRLRYREETNPNSGRYHVRYRTEHWQASQTAVIVCDMWDLHHCLNAVRRCREMAPRMNQVLAYLRDAGAAVIHAPSGCMEFYREHPARLRAQQVPKARNLPAEIGSWCHKIPAEERGPYPIDQSDGGEDDDPFEHAAWVQILQQMGRNPRAPWTRQSELLEIDPQRDYISDRGEEIWSILEARGIHNVILVGVHTNMCVLGRPFGLRNMSRYGKNVVLMRDMTDTMYNPNRAPYVSHFTGTDLIVEHIEKFVCPTITSDQLLGGEPFRFSADRRPTLTILCSEPEYHTERTLPPWALEELGKEFRVMVVYGEDSDGNRMPGLHEALREADVVLMSVRRRALPAEDMAALRAYLDAGKPVVAIRTSSHAFSLRGASPPEGHVTWETWDPEILGGNYTGHYPAGPVTSIQSAPEASGHPILEGVDVEALVGRGSLYKVRPLRPGTVPLLLGTIHVEGMAVEPEPVAWTYLTPAGGRVFYTSLGHEGDFTQPAFRLLLANAVRWAAGRIAYQH
ncbi:MAG: hypothetical protein KatS3mg110_2043 [Pirellulaceae bacterium]|nr:MAG: hypothetical protein KatS3mg110_2043 [Pirellulaceae bacterium]